MDNKICNIFQQAKSHVQEDLTECSPKTRISDRLQTLSPGNREYITTTQHGKIQKLERHSQREINEETSFDDDRGCRKKLKNT